MKLLILLTSLLSVQALGLAIKPTKGSIEFKAMAKPSFLQINGVGDMPTGQAEIDSNGKLTAEFELKLDSLDSKNNTRNSHMKEKYLQVDKFPTAKLKITELELGKSWSIENPEISKTFTGQLTMHGAMQPIEGRITVQKSSPVKAEAEFEIKISDFQIDPPNFAGLTVTDLVKIKVIIDQFKTE